MLVDNIDIENIIKYPRFSIAMLYLSLPEGISFYSPRGTMLSAYVIAYTFIRCKDVWYFNLAW